MSHLTRVTQSSVTTTCRTQRASHAKLLQRCSLGHLRSKPRPHTCENQEITQLGPKGGLKNSSERCPVVTLIAFFCSLHNFLHL